KHPGSTPKSAFPPRTARALELQRQASALPEMADARRRAFVDEVVQFLGSGGKEHGIEIVIVFDSTGSMRREIDAVKERIETIGNAVLRKIPHARFSLV